MYTTTKVKCTVKHFRTVDDRRRRQLAVTSPRTLACWHGGRCACAPDVRTPHLGGAGIAYRGDVTFELEPVTGNSISINGWNWRPTLELLHRTAIMSAETLELMSFTGGGGQATSGEAERIAEFLDS